MLLWKRRMKSQCIKAVQAAIGRTLGKGEAQRIEERITSNLRELARKDPAFSGMSKQQQLLAAAKESMTQDMAQAAKAVQRKALNVAAQSREAANLSERAATIGGKNPFHKALFERLNQLQNHIQGISNEMFSNLFDTMQAAAPRFWDLLENKEAVSDFTHEVYGEKTGNAIAEKAAKAYLETIESIRLRMNAAGAAIWKLDYSYLPQPHDVGAIFKAGKDAWVSAILPKMARDRYFNSDGTRMDDAQMVDFLGHSYDTLATEGALKREPGKGGQGSRASRHDEAHRALHFKDAASYLDYMRDFGKGSTFESIHNHVMAMGKDIGLMEEFGSNPNATYKLLKDTAEIGDSKIAGKAVKGSMKSGATTDMWWDTINGTAAAPVNIKMAEFFGGVRNSTAATKLGGVMLSSINDAPMWLAVAKYNGIDLSAAGGHFFKSLSDGHIVDDAARLGIGVESMSGAMQAWHADNLKQGWSGKLANTTMKIQLVESWTNRLRAGMGLMLQDHLAKLKNTDFGALSAFDRDRFKAGGISERDWQIWQAAKPETIRGRQMLTKNSVRDVIGFNDAEVNHATAALLGFIDNETKTAVLAPDLQTRAAMTQGGKRGTLGGEIGRTMMLFKSFPLAMVLRNIDRIRSIPSVGGKIAYSVPLITGLTLFGALSIELKDLVAGKNPRPANTPKFWGAAFAQGGGLGIFGDILYTGMGGNSRGGQANWTSLAGPVAGTAADALNVTLGNLGQVMQGKDPKAGAELLRFTRQNLPFLNLWYVKAAIDHAFFNDLQESVSPGYLSRQRASARRDWGTSYWWEPGAKTPEGPPDLTTIAGQR